VAEATSWMIAIRLRLIFAHSHEPNRRPKLSVNRIGFDYSAMLKFASLHLPNSTSFDWRCPREKRSQGRHSDDSGMDPAQSPPSAAISAVPGAVFSGSLDGHLRAYSTDNGKIIWDYDTVREYQTVNGMPLGGS
jgi:hypothetical protein